MAISRRRRAAPAANVEKMSAGKPLDDDDRQPWIEAIGSVMRETDYAGNNTVIACSALRSTYRDFLARQSSTVRFVLLRGTRETLLKRMRSRSEHFMPADLLDSQLATLEEPDDAIVADIEESPENIVTFVVEALQASPGR